jgi:tyrosyl-tRNA synthetase
MNFVEELKWRGMIHDIMPGTEELLNKETTTGYIGFDPTSDSLHIGHMVQVMLLVHFQRSGHVPVALVGGATGMIGDPSGKSEERNLLDENTLRFNQEGIKKQLSKFLDFQSDKKTRAIMVNNYDWMKEYSYLGFIRDIGKHITVNYMMAKDSVKKRLDTGLSFTEFSYQLVQGYDFLYLNQHKNCKLQMGGSDQWGNITTGTELIRRKTGGEAYALTCPLITKTDGGKFGKTEEGNVWLDPVRTSPYKFYQFWLNTSDEDAEKYIKIFTLLSKEEIYEMIVRHRKAPHIRELQKALAMDLTVRIHSQADYQASLDASAILFGAGTTETLKNLSEDIFLSVFEGVPQSEISKNRLDQGIQVLEFLADLTGIFSSRGEARRTIRENALSINKEKVGEDKIVGVNDLLNRKYILVQKGKKNYFLVTLH